MAGCKVEALENLETGRSRVGEFNEKFVDRIVVHDVHVPSSIEGLERLGDAEPEDHLGAWYPVGVLPMNKMTNDVVSVPGVGAFVSSSPRIG